MLQNRAVVWDLDGVIVDSAEAHNDSWVAMAQEYGVKYDREHDFKAIFGRHNSDIIIDLWGVTDPTEISLMTESKESNFRQTASKLKALPGVLELMRALREAGWKQGIGSSAPLRNINILLEASGAGVFMDAIASGDDVSEGKPNPQVFLIAFKRLGVCPDQGVVIEDAPAGIEGARRAGAAALGVTTTQTRDVLENGGAHLVVNTLEGIDLNILEALVQANAEAATQKSATEKAD